MNYIKIGTIEPCWNLVPENWNENEMREVLAFIAGAFTKYSDDKKSEYTDMNQDLCDYVRHILHLNNI